MATNVVTPINTDHAAALPENKTPGEKRKSSITWGITIITSISLILTLLGYGVSLAVETTFGVPHQTVYSSAFDLIGLSVYALISVVLGLGKITWQPVLEQLWLPGLISAAIMFSALCCVIYLRARQTSVRARTNRFWRYFGPPTKTDTTGQLVIKGATISGLFGAAMLAVPFLLIAAVMTTMLLISVVPIFGMQLGEHFIKEFVVSPTACEPVKSRATILQALSGPKKKKEQSASSATCIAILKDGKRVESGRVVVSTATTVVLFEPTSGATWRLPTSGLTIQATDIVDAISTPKK